MKTRNRWNASELAEKYQSKFGISIAPFLTQSEIQLHRESETGIWKFNGCDPGSGEFYEALGELPYYYMENKWEFDEAIKGLREESRDIRILEVGCGSGAFLNQLRESGFQNIQGLELNEAAKSQCCQNGHAVRSEMTSSLIQRGEKFDYVFAFQVLEHVPDPAQFLSELISLVPEDGHVIVATPNKNAFPKRYRWDLLDLPPHHMSRWDAQSYSQVSELLEVELADIKYEPLAKYHYKFYTSSFLDSLPQKSLRRAFAKLFVRAGFFAYPWKSKIQGHSMMVTLRRPKSNAKKQPWRAAA